MLGLGGGSGAYCLEELISRKYLRARSGMPPCRAITARQNRRCVDGQKAKTRHSCPDCPARAAAGPSGPACAGPTARAEAGGEEGEEALLSSSERRGAERSNFSLFYFFYFPGCGGVTPRPAAPEPAGSYFCATAAMLFPSSLSAMVLSGSTTTQIRPPAVSGSLSETEVELCLLSIRQTARISPPSSGLSAVN